MSLFYPLFIFLTILAATIAVFGKNFRLRILSSWVCSLILSFIFLNLKNEFLAFTLCFMSTVLTWTVVTQSLVFGEIQRNEDEGSGWRSAILPTLGALMVLALVILGLPGLDFFTTDVALPDRLPVTVLGTQIFHRFFLFSAVVAAVAFAAMVGVGMITRTEWKQDGGDS